MKTAVREQVNALDAVAYFTLLAQLMKRNPPAAADAAEVAKFAKIGLVPGKDFDCTRIQCCVRTSPRSPYDRSRRDAAFPRFPTRRPLNSYRR
jgi:hypothetical protein